MEGLSILDIINRIMKFEIHYDEHIERVVVIEAESIEDAEEMIDDLDHSQSAIIDTTYEVWAIRELPEKPKPYADRV
jgi:demethoxyubiquinone hydroxylase (CLK1/Coq7/Cat5 family)